MSALENRVNAPKGAKPALEVSENAGAFENLAPNSTI